jgi:hypothetical protein
MMSRTQRKNPIQGVTTARSEADDKRIWHGRWRCTERDNLIKLKHLDDYITTHKNEVSNPWAMDKDGKVWRSAQDMKNYAERIASYKAKGNKNLALKLKARILAKWKAK